MNQYRLPSGIFLAIFVFFFTVYLAWLDLAQISNSSQLPSTLTATPYFDFSVNIPAKTIFKNRVTVSVKAPSGTKCKLIYVPPKGSPHEMNAVSNASSICEWTWKVEETEGKGHGRLIFTINGISKTHFIEILANF